MEITKSKIESIKEDLEEILSLMEDYGVEELKLESNTYFCSSDFISFRGKGFLDLDIFSIREEIEEAYYSNNEE